MRARLVLLTLAIALIASGCFRVHLDVEVNEDGSGTLSGLAALNVKAVEDLAGALTGEGGADELCAQFEADQGLDDPTIDSAKPYRANGWCGVEFTDSFTADEFEESVGQLAADGAILERRGDGWYFEMPVDTESLGTGDLDGAEMLPGFDELLGEAEYIIRVKLPGRQVENNADYIDNEGFAVWEISITNPPTSSLFLRTEPGEPIVGSKSPPGTRGDGGGGNTFVIVVVVIMILAAIALGLWLWMRRRKTDGEGEPGPETTVPDPTLPPPPVGADPSGRRADLAGVSTADAVGDSTPGDTTVLADQPLPPPDGTPEV